MATPGINKPGGPVTDQSIPGAPTFGSGEDNTGIGKDVDRDDTKSLSKTEKQKALTKGAPPDKKGADDKKQSKKKVKPGKRIAKRMKEKKL
jgi:hypothetical protein